MFGGHYHQPDIDEVVEDLQSIDCPKLEWYSIEEKVDHPEY